MMRRLSMLACGFALAAFGGCSFLPTYHAPADVPTAQVKLADRGGKSACVGNKAWHLEPDAQGNVSLPLDERVTLWSFYSWAGANVTYSCSPATSFVPRAGQHYTMVFEVEPENHSCSYRPYRQTTENRIGLDFEPTIGPPRACGKP